MTTVITNPDPDMMQLITLKGALKLYAKTGMLPTRGMTITRMLALATSITGKPYKRGQAQKASDDLHALWNAHMAGHDRIQPSTEELQ